MRCRSMFWIEWVLSPCDEDDLLLSRLHAYSNVVIKRGDGA